jgi:DNA-directed RNA polymerase delta subunit
MSIQKLNSHKAFLDELKDERSELAAELSKLDLIIEAMESRIKDMQGASITLTADGAVVNPRTQSIPENLGKPSGIYAEMTIHDAAESLLDKLKRPLTIRQIWKTLVEGGQSETKYNAVYTALWRRVDPKGNFIRFGESEWGLASWKVPFAKPRDSEPSEVANTPRRTQARSKPSQLDLCENVLRDSQKPMHINMLIARLAEMNRPTTVHSLSSTLRQDTRGRFENLGGNIWVLTEWPESAKNQGRKETPLLNEI